VSARKNTREGDVSLCACCVRRQQRKERGRETNKSVNSAIYTPMEYKARTIKQ
jgi:hypothetical protein